MLIFFDFARENWDGPKPKHSVVSYRLSVGEVGNLASEARCLDPEVAPTAKKPCAKTETIGELNNSQGHLVVHIYFISVDTFYEIGLDFHAISRKNVNIRKLKSKAEPKTK